MKLKDREISLSKSEIKKLLKNATGFCKWDDFEKGFIIRDKNAQYGLDSFLIELKNSSHGLHSNNIVLHYNNLLSAVRAVIDESYYLYYDLNGTFRADKFKNSECNEIVNRIFKKFIL